MAIQRQAMDELCKYIPLPQQNQTQQSNQQRQGQ